MFFNTTLRTTAVVLLAMGAVACGRIAPHARTVEVVRLELESADYERLDYVEGEDCVARYLTFFRLFSPDVVAAAGRALQQAPDANFLANRHVSMEERFFVPFVYHEVCAVVEGRAVRLHTANARGANAQGPEQEHP